MPKNFKELRKKMSPESRARSSAMAREIVAEARLAEVRRAREMTQSALAAAMETSQGEISKIEKRADCYVSTIRQYIEALDGELEIVARFPDGQTVKINQFADLTAA